MGHRKFQKSVGCLRNCIRRTKQAATDIIVKTGKMATLGGSIVNLLGNEKYRGDYNHE